MPIRITGLNSGLDTESIISALVSSYSYKTSKYFLCLKMKIIMEAGGMEYLKLQGVQFLQQCW